MQCSLVNNKCSVGCVAYGTFGTYQYDIQGVNLKFNFRFSA